ncbi:MAG: 6-carboxytetrahydropterin synthase [Prevotellaceae bacterium]|jgi:6-pyruvoyltetrahydropterin/6-carboxytetrahydropterin synthase|nr:6-carboxytetrahydropterin synthase [Prevotellaceae bacterium]
MKNIRLTKQFTLEMAHALEGYDGKCRHIHGHSYILYVTIMGTPCNDKLNPKYGMVMDFGELKAIVNKHIIDKLDHALILCNDAVLSTELQQQYGSIILTDYQPTCENMIINFAGILKNELPATVKLHSLRLHETATSYAEWYAADNK